jgi:hypothetical protein
MEENNDPYLAIAEEGSQSIIEGAVIGGFLVDAVPFLKYLPAWIPGASFQRKARSWREASKKLYRVPFEAMEEKIVRAVISRFLVQNLLTIPGQRYIHKLLCSSLFGEICRLYGRRISQRRHSGYSCHIICW